MTQPSREITGLLAGLLDGRPVEGAWEPVFPLLTPDPGGEPRVCLLSRAELEADGEQPGLVRCAVRSRRTSDNLRRAGVAVLLVVDGTDSWSVRTRMGRVVADDGGLAAELIVTGVERDSLGIPLRPMRFRVDSTLAALERWDDNARLLARLKGPAPGSP
jgi:hypothetical protein